jgi:hypothetical protein
MMRGLFLVSTTAIFCAAIWFVTWSWLQVGRLRAQVSSLRNIIERHHDVATVHAHCSPADRERAWTADCDVCRGVPAS